MVDVLWVGVALLVGMLIGILTMRFTVASVIQDALTKWSVAEQELSEIVREIQVEIESTEVRVRGMVNTAKKTSEATIRVIERATTAIQQLANKQDYRSPW